MHIYLVCQYHHPLKFDQNVANLCVYERENVCTYGLAFTHTHTHTPSHFLSLSHTDLVQLTDIEYLAGRVVGRVEHEDLGFGGERGF
jgi:hypothetical protein